MDDENQSLRLAVLTPGTWHSTSANAGSGGSAPFIRASKIEIPMGRITWVGGIKKSRHVVGRVATKLAIGRDFETVLLHPLFPNVVTSYQFCPVTRRIKVDNDFFTASTLKVIRRELNDRPLWSQRWIARRSRRSVLWETQVRQLSTAVVDRRPLSSCALETGQCTTSVAIGRR